MACSQFARLFDPLLTLHPTATLHHLVEPRLLVVIEHGDLREAGETQLGQLLGQQRTDATDEDEIVALTQSLTLRPFESRRTRRRRW